MLRSERLIPACAMVATTILATLCLSCGSSSNPNLSAAQAQAVSQQLFIAVGDALASGLTGAQPGDASHPRLPDVIAAVHPAKLSSDCTITDSTQSCNIPISYNGQCPNGGGIGVTGDFIFTLDHSGSGTNNSTLTVTPKSCAVSNTTFNGDPSVTVTAQFSLKNNEIAYPITFTEVGGISFGPNRSGSCALNANLSVTSATTCTVTGNICGQPVNGSC